MKFVMIQWMVSLRICNSQPLLKIALLDISEVCVKCDVAIVGLLRMRDDLYLLQVME